MKKIFNLGVLQLLLIALLCGCSEDDNKSTPPFNLDGIPSEATNFISEYFKSHDYESALFRNTPDENGKMYGITLSGDICLDFDTEGKWLLIDGNEKALSENILRIFRYSRVKDYIDDYNKRMEYDEFKGFDKITKRNYGFNIQLKNGSNVAFDDSEFYWGEEFSNKTDNLHNAYNYFIPEHFPDADISIQIMNHRDYGPFFTLYLSDGFILDFNMNGDVVGVSSVDLNKEIPGSIVKGLPESLKEYLKDYNYPIVKIEKKDLVYSIQMRVSDKYHFITWDLNTQNMPSNINEFILTHLGAFGHAQIKGNKEPNDNGAYFEITYDDKYYLEFDKYGRNLLFMSLDKTTALPESYLYTINKKMITYITENYPEKSICYTKNTDGGLFIVFILDDGTELKINYSGGLV